MRSLNVPKALPAFQPASIAKFHPEAGVVVNHFEHSILRSFVPYQTWDASNFLNGWVIGVQGQLHVVLFTVRQHPVQKLLEVGPKFLLGLLPVLHIGHVEQTLLVAASGESVATHLVVK